MNTGGACLFCSAAPHTHSRDQGGLKAAMQQKNKNTQGGGGRGGGGALAFLLIGLEGSSLTHAARAV